MLISGIEKLAKRKKTVRMCVDSCCFPCCFHYSNHSLEIHLSSSQQVSYSLLRFSVAKCYTQKPGEHQQGFKMDYLDLQYRQPSFPKLKVPGYTRTKVTKLTNEFAFFRLHPLLLEQPTIAHPSSLCFLSIFTKRSTGLKKKTTPKRLQTISRFSVSVNAWTKWLPTFDARRILGGRGWSCRFACI